jgi:8-oxo-dGTP pyrophosphatase MutT (NUDIX family)
MSSPPDPLPMAEPSLRPDLAPDWLVPLVAAAQTVDRAAISSLPVPRAGGRRSAVLILIGSEDSAEPRPNVLITERAHTLRHHPGQPSFPGGRVDLGDPGPVSAALREAVEETGVDPAGVLPVATLPDLFLPVSSSVVTPVIGWWRDPSPVRVVDPAEVASVHAVGVDDLTDPANRLMVHHPSGFTGPAFRVAGLLVWGFTAGLLDRVLYLAGWERPWDRGHVEPLPPDVLRLSRRDLAEAGAPTPEDDAGR